MSEPKYAPKREDGLMAYVIAETSWGRTTETIEWCDSLAEAKSIHGWTRQAHTSRTVRRATPADLDGAA